MKLFKLLLVAVIMLMALSVSEVHARQIYDAKYKDEILSKVIPTVTIAIVNADTVLRDKPSALSLTSEELKKGTIVEVLQDSTAKWYKVENADLDASGWLPSKSIDILDPQEKKLEDMTEEELEAFANIMDFPTDSNFFIWTDIARQKTHVFEKQNEIYVHIKTFACASGKNITPTTRGFFTISDRGKWFYAKRFNSGAKYWVRFNGTYLFHSVAMDKKENITDGILGERRSSGCIRHGVTDAKWIFDNITRGTTVFVH